MDQDLEIFPSLGLSSSFLPPTDTFSDKTLRCSTSLCGPPHLSVTMKETQAPHLFWITMPGVKDTSTCPLPFPSPEHQGSHTPRHPFARLHSVPLNWWITHLPPPSRGPQWHDPTRRGGMSLPCNDIPAQAPRCPGDRPRPLLHHPGALLVVPQLPFAILASGLPGPWKATLVMRGIYVLFTNISLGTGAKFIWEGTKGKVRCSGSPFLFWQVYAPAQPSRQVRGVPARCGSLALQRDLKKSLSKGGNVTNSHLAACCCTMARQTSAWTNTLTPLPVKVKMLWRDGLMHRGA